MAIIFFLAQDNKTQVKLDSEASIEVSLPSTVSNSSVMTGQSVSDDVIEGNAIITVTGLVTYAKMPAQEGTPNPIQFQELIQEARRNRRRFTVFAKDSGQPLLQDYEDCVISDVGISVDRYSDAITVSIVFEQIFISESAKKTFLAPKRKESVKPNTSDTKDSGQSTKTKTEEDESRTIAVAMVDEGTKLVKSAVGIFTGG